MPMVSICIPVYNGEEFLRECIESALGQTIEDIEIVIVDDCSNDNSVDIIKEYCEKDKRILFFRNEKNLGLVGNWNKCISLANGEWIKFIFQDDYMQNNCVEKYIEAADKTANVSSLIVSKRKFLTEGLDKNKQDYFHYKLPTLDKAKSKRNSGFISSKEISNLAIKYLALNYIGEPTVVMFKKNIITELGFFNLALDQVCDLEYFLRIGSSFGIIYISEQLTSFRIHDKSVSSLNNSEKRFELDFLEPLKFSHLLLYNTDFTKLRSALSWFNMIKLKLYFNVKKYETIKFINTNENVKEKYFNSEKEFPHIKVKKKPSLLIKVIYNLTRFKRIIN